MVSKPSAKRKVTLATEWRPGGTIRAMDRFLRRTSQPQAQKAGHALQPIRLYSAELALSAWVDPANERITDILSRGDELAVLPEGRDPGDPDAWVSVNADDLLLVVPPPHTSPPELRMHRQRQRVLARVEPYVVTGTAHLKPGEAEDPFLRATRPFLPLTDAVIEQAETPPAQLEVVIVNFRHLTELREL